MVAQKKYEKYVSQGIFKTDRFTEKGGQIAIPVYYDIRTNPLTPHFIEVGFNITPHASGYGEVVLYSGGIPWKTFPHKHHVCESFTWFGTDPDRPDELGGTIEQWLGEGEDAEAYIIDKPQTLLLPPNTLQFPLAYREIHRPFMTFMVLDSPLSNEIAVPKLPSKFDPKVQIEEPEKTQKKYRKLFTGRSVSDLAVFPSHKGKSHAVTQFGMKENELAPHFIEIHLIYGSGIGWGCGDIAYYPDFPDLPTRSLPHRHPYLETYCFFGTDKDNIEDLGGTVEFWIGEGAEAEEYIITRPTVILVPPNTVHLPLYVREVHSPFVSAAFLDTPIRTMLTSDNYPQTFTHVNVK